MSIRSELEKSASYLRNARKAILGRGGEISLTAGLKDLPDAIYNIPADASLSLVTDKAIAYQKNVPARAEEYARISKLGGMTYKTVNLIPTQTFGSVTKSGITYTCLDDGAISVNGSNTTTTVTAELVLMRKSLAAGTYTYSFGKELPAGVYASVALYANGSWVKNLGNFSGDDGTKSLTFTLTQEVATANVVSLNYCVMPNYSVSDFVAYPMLNEGSTALPYEPYFEGLRDVAVTELVSDSANLFNALAEESLPSNTAMSNKTPRIFEPNTMIVGMSYANYYRPVKVTSVSREEGSITFTGLNGYGLGFAFDLKPNTQYTVSCTRPYNEVYIGVCHYSDEGEPISWKQGEPTKNYYTFTTTESGKVVITFAFVNQDEKTTLTISNIMMVEGAEAAPYKPYRTEPVETFPVHEAIQSLDGYGQGNPDNEQEYNYIDFVRKVFVAVGHIVNGAWVSYNAPIETDISAYLPNDGYIKVEGGGTITMQNEHERDIPSTLKYIAKVGS